MRGFIKACLPTRWELAGVILLSLGTVCFHKAGEIEYAERYVWEEAERLQKQEAAKREEDPGRE